jgi:hypothetical protein
MTTRREFLTSAASGVGLAALSSLLGRNGLLLPPDDIVNPLAPRPPHFPARAKSCIFLFMAGGPSQFDLFDPKPKLRELHGQPMPASMLEDVRFAFVQPEAATLKGSWREFLPRGECGMELSDLLPHIGSVADDLLLVRSMHTDEFNHHPAQLLMQCGRSVFGLPSMGSWVMYGLGSENENLPGYVVLTAGRGSSGGATLWQSGFMPSLYAGTPFRNRGEPVLNLRNPRGLPPRLQRRGLDALRHLNEVHAQAVGDPEIDSRIASYELAARMQLAAPEILRWSDEPESIQHLYGIDREDPQIKADRFGGLGQYRSFATNCLLARRLVERGVRFVNVIHASWDHHSNLDVELPFNARMADQPVAALIKDLKQRGLLDETLVVCASEFGRTPLGENRQGEEPNTGRDHHPFAFSIFMAGGGLKGGQVWGETDELGWRVVRDPVHVNDLHATLLHLMGLDHEQLTYRFQGRDFRLTDVAGEVVDGWIA